MVTDNVLIQISSSICKSPLTYSTHARTELLDSFQGAKEEFKPKHLFFLIERLTDETHDFLLPFSISPQNQ